MAPHSDYVYKPQKGSGLRVSYARTYEYNDEGRGKSLELWTWFEAHFQTADEKKVWLMNQDDLTCYGLIQGSTFRYGIEDIATINSADLDTRARRLVSKTLSLADWNEYWQHLVDGYNRRRGEIEQQAEDNREKSDQEWEAMRQARLAKRLIVEDNDRQTMTKTVELSAGSLHAEFSEAFRLKERTDGDEGDWMDDAVSAYSTGHGWGTEERQTASVKLQITLSLDKSNSMYYNHIHTQAMQAFFEIGETLRSLHAEYPNDLFVGFFEFSLDDYRNGRGKMAKQLTDETYADHPDFGALYPYRPSKIAEVYGQGDFQGEDTWISPLFSKIEEWENEASDTGAIRLDLVITDAVLEHKTDIIEASTIQDRRDGALQSVLLNLMPETEWLASTLPRHTYQYHVDAGNLSATLRSLISEFVSVHL